MLPGVIVGVAGHAFAILTAWAVDRMIAPSLSGSEDVATMAIAFLAAELLVILAGLMVGWVFIPKENRAARTGLLLGWLLGAFAAWIVIRGY